MKKLMTRRFLIFLCLLVALAVAVYAASLLPTADWFETFDPAARGVFSGLLPYERSGYVYPPWAVVPLLPIVLFPANIAHGLMFVVSLLILVYIMWRLRLPALAAAAFLVSPTAVGALLVNNIDPFIIAGILFPPAWGLFLLVIKPQIGFGVTLFYLVETYRLGRFRQVLKTFVPVSAAYLLSALFFPVWIERMLNNPQNPWNRSVFPYAIPLGIFLLWLSIRKRNPYFALASAPFLVPYHTFYTYIVVQIGLMHPDVEKYIRRDLLQIILCVFFWVIMLMFRL
jgi:hypothetical protein